MFKSANLVCQFDDANSLIRFKAEAVTACYDITMSVYEEKQQFTVCVHSPIIVPRGCRPSLAEALAWVNCGVPFGRFELDCRNGKLVFIVSTGCDGNSLSRPMVFSSLCFAVHKMDIYLPAFLSIIYGNESPKDAVQSVE